MLNQPANPAAPPTASLRITKICIRTPDDYNGKPETSQAWMDSVCLYLLINNALYHNDDRKIAFALPYMKKGTATTWAEVCCQQRLATQTFGTFATFQVDFEVTFGNTHSAQEAMSWLSTTCIDSGEQLAEYINNFKLNVTHIKYDEVKDAATLILYFSTGLPTWLMHCIQAMDAVPTTITGWYDKATHFYLQKEIAHKAALMHQGSTPQNAHTNYVAQPQNPQPVCDSNAMDIDALNLSPVERSCCLCDRLCFICKQSNCSTRNHP